MSTIFAENMHDVGTTIRLTLNVSTLDPVPEPIDPLTVTLKVRAPDGIATSKTTHRDSKGSFYAEFIVTQVGQYRYRWVTGAPVRAQEGSFLVRESEYAQDGVVELFVTYGVWRHLTEGQLNELTYGAF